MHRCVVAAMVTLVSGVAAGAVTLSGSGVVIGAKGEILTNAHVVEACQTITVKFASGNSETGALVARGQRNDLAVIRLAGTNSPPASVTMFRDSAPLRAGDAIVALGYPLSGVLAADANVSVGNVSALAGIADDSRYLQISAPVQPGSSGGPLFDASGHLVGIVTAKLDALRVAKFTGDIPQNVNFALKAEVARTFLNSKGIAYQTARSDLQLSPAEVGGIARPFTVQVECEQAGSRSATTHQIANPQADTGGEQTVEQFDQCIDPASSLDQIIKACTASIQWMTAHADSPHPVLLYERRGSAYYEKSEYDLAIADFTDAIHLNPMDSDAYFDRGEAYEDKRDYERAIRDFTKVVVSGSVKNAASAAFRIGSIYSKTRDYDQAMHWYRLAADKGNSGAMTMIATYYAARIQPDCNSARSWLKKAIAAGNEIAKQDLRSGFEGRCHWQN